MHKRQEYFEQQGNMTVSCKGPKQIKQVKISPLILAFGESICSAILFSAVFIF